MWSVPSSIGARRAEVGDVRPWGARSVRYRAVPRYYITTPIYYVKDAPHVGHAYTTVNADALARWHRLIGDDVFFLTGTDEHGQKVARAAEEQGLAPPEWTDRLAPRFASAWADLDISNDDFIRTTEPRHHEAVQQFLGRIYENGYIYKDIYRGPVLRALRAVLRRGRADRRQPVPDPPHAGGAPRGGELLLPPERLRAAAHRLVRGQPRRGGSRVEAQRGPQLHQGRAPGHLHHPHVDRLGRPGPVGREARLLRLVRRPHQLPDRHRLRPGRAAVRGVVAGRPPSDRQGDHPVPLRVVAGHVHGRRHRSAGPRPGARLAAARGREDVQLERQPDLARATSPPTSGSTRSATTCCGTSRSAADGDFSAEGIVARYNADLANNLGNLLSRVATVVGSKCGGIGPAPAADSRLAAVSAAVVEEVTQAWAAGLPHLALEATWRLIRETNAELETAEPWKAEPGPEVDAVLGSALEVLRIVAILVVPAMPSTAEEIWRRIGLEGAPATSGCRTRRRWGGYPAGPAGGEGRSALPATQVASRGVPCTTR